MQDKDLIAVLWKLLVDIMVDGNMPTNQELDDIETYFTNRGFMEENDDLLEVDLSDGPGWVYVIYVGNGNFKIGETKNLQIRLKQIVGKEILKTIKTNYRLSLEKQLHNRYDDVRLTPSQEIFRLNQSHIEEIYSMEDEVQIDIPYNDSLKF